MYKMHNMTKSAWTDELVAKLRTHVDEGLTGRQIGQILGFTRNAIISKTKRLHITLGVNRPQPVRKPRSPFRLRPHRFPLTPLPLRPLPIMALMPELPAEELAPVNDNYPLLQGSYKLLDLEPHQCRWPMDEELAPAVHFCGAETSCPPYCKYHALRAFRPGYARLRPVRVYGRSYNR